MRRTLAITGTLALLVSLAACGKKAEDMTAREVRAKYSQQFLAGMDYGLRGRIKARAIDPATHDLLDVRIEEIDHKILNAKRGELIIDTNANTLAIRLVGVTTADIETGALTTVPMFLTEEIDLGFDVVE